MGSRLSVSDPGSVSLTVRPDSEAGGAEVAVRNSVETTVESSCKEV